MFSSTSHLISSLARHLGKNLLVCLIHPWQCSAVMSWHAASIASRRDIWSCGRWSKTISRLRKTPQWGWGKGSKGQRKGTSSSDGHQTSLWLHGNGGMPHCPMWSHILTGLPPVPFLPLAQVYRASLLKTGEGGRCCMGQSHIYSGVHHWWRLRRTWWCWLLSGPAR